MSNEEAEQLIAEVCNYLTEQQIITNVRIGTEKIIKRFANKPPKEGYRVNIGIGSNIHLQSYQSTEYKYNVLLWVEDDHSESRTCLNIKQLTELRDNCTKMLEYLENE